MDDLSDMPVPTLAPAFTLVASPGGSLVVGRLATGGTRQHRLYASGRFAGRGIEGALVTGSETLLHRPDDVTTVEANFLVATSDGAMLRLIGIGYETDAPFAGTRMTIVIEADEDGPHAALTTRAFAAERLAGSDTLAIAAIE